MKPLKELVRPNIWALKPYSSARDEYHGKAAHTFLDANESPYNVPLNRYPDPLQEELKQAIAPLKGVEPSQIFLGNGSDEAIDLVFRVFCVPQRDNVVAIEPTYGMYQVCADINNVEYRKVLLGPNFELEPHRLLEVVNERTKVVFLCSPNNPTGNCLDPDAIETVVRQFQGIVVVDEAYSDFSTKPQFRLRLNEFPNLIVLNTFSKAWASAAIRLGMAFASPDIISLFTKVKYPYNVNALTMQAAADILGRRFEVDRWVKQILQERTALLAAVSELPICQRVFPTDANFFLARIDQAGRVYEHLVSQGIIVRNRSGVTLCNDCLRITVGSHTENNRLLAALRQYRPQS